MPYGYCESKIEVNLTTKKIEKRPLEPELMNDFLGGAGFAIKILYDGLKPRIDPFSPENIVVFATGPAQGTLVPGSGRCIAVSKSPLTGSSFRSTFGGFFGNELKRAGYDLIAVRGRSDEPVSLVIDDEDVELKGASHLWGKTTYETQRLLKEDVGDKKAQITCIGPAGENLVRYASIVHDIHVGGRGGLGGVMGSKRLKAIAVRGRKAVEVADPEGLKEFWVEISNRVGEKAATKNFRRYGTTFVVGSVSKVGGLGTRNWQTEFFEGWEKITGETTIPECKVQDLACPPCPIGCVKIQEVKEGRYRGSWSKGPEYETLYALGSVVGVDDFGVIVAAARACDELGVDTISTGVCAAFAMECYEKGLITREETGGLDLKFGNGPEMIDLIENIAYRRGLLGNTLAEGVRRASKIIGLGSQAFAMHVKGLELAGHSPRALKAVGLGYAVAHRGGSHHDCRAHAWDYGRPLEERAFTIENKPRIVTTTQEMAAIGDSLIVCRLYESIYGLSVSEDHCRILRLTTGVSKSPEDLVKVAERIWNLERCFAVREGFTRRDDVLPPRVLFEPIPGGPSRGAHTKPRELRVMLDEYYKIRGWDPKTGIPTREKLEELGLGHAARDIGKDMGS